MVSLPAARLRSSASPLRTRETVDTSTPASLLISLSVTRCRRGDMLTSSVVIRRPLSMLIDSRSPQTSPGAGIQACDSERAPDRFDITDTLQRREIRRGSSGVTAARPAPLSEQRDQLLPDEAYLAGA